MTNVRPLTRATPAGPAPARAPRGDEPRPKAALRWLRHTREIEAVIFTMVAGVALLAYRDVFGSVTDFIGPAAGAVVGGAAVGLLTRGRRIEPYAYLVSLGLGSLFIIYSVLPS